MDKRFVTEGKSMPGRPSAAAIEKMFVRADEQQKSGVGPANGVLIGLKHADERHPKKKAA